MGGRARDWLSFAPVLAVSLLVQAGCDAPPSVRIEPSVLRVSPSDRDVRVDLVNDGASDVEVAQLRIEGEDWTAFAIQNETNPDRIPAGDRVSLDLRVTRRAFAHAGHGHGYATYRPGRAELALELAGAKARTPLEFHPAPRLADVLWTALVSLVLLMLGLWGAQLTRRGLLRRFPGPSGPAGPKRARALSSPMTTAVGFGLLGAAWATMPIGDALCIDQLQGHAHLLDLAQCRRGLGGGPIALAALDGGLALWWAALAAVFAAAIVGTPRRARSLLGREFLPLAVIALAAAGPAVVHGTLDPAAIVRAQLAQDHSAAMWGWGAASQPVAAVLALLALAQLRSPSSPDTRDWPAWSRWLPTRMLGLHGLAAACMVTLFFGGWTLPALPPLGHLASVSLGAAAFALKMGVVSFSAARLANRGKRSPTSRTAAWTPSSALLLALAVANLGATIALSAG